IRQFGVWFEEAAAAALLEPNAMTLATATADGRPSARMVLLKEVDTAGFVFYTNFEGRKARELGENPWAALVFFWVDLSRRVRGGVRVERVPAADPPAYSAPRPPGTQTGAWSAAQSAVTPGREVLERGGGELEAEYAGPPVPRPPFWGGYRVVPEA